MPDPMMAPIPSAVSDHGPSDFFSRCAGSSESEISLSMDFLANSWLARSASLEIPTSTATQKSGHHDAPNACHPERARVSALGANEHESKDPDRVSSAMPFQGVLSKTRPITEGTRSSRPSIHNYRFAWPLASFFTFGFFDPRG